MKKTLSSLAAVFPFPLCFLAGDISCDDFYGALHLGITPDSLEGPSGDAGDACKATALLGALFLCSLCRILSNVFEIHGVACFSNSIFFTHRAVIYLHFLKGLLISK